MPREINVGGISLSINAETGEFKTNVEVAAKLLALFQKEAQKTGRSTSQVAKTYGVANTELKKLERTLKETAGSQGKLDLAGGSDASVAALQEIIQRSKEAQEAAKELRGELQEALQGRQFTKRGSERLPEEVQLERLIERSKEVERITSLIDLAKVKQETTTATNIVLEEQKRLTNALQEIQQRQTIERREQLAIQRQDNDTQNELKIQEEQAANVIRNEQERQRTASLKTANAIQLANAKSANMQLVDDHKQQNKLLLEEEKARFRLIDDTRRQAASKELEKIRQVNSLKRIDAQKLATIEIQNNASKNRIIEQQNKNVRRAEENSSKNAVRNKEREGRAAKQASRSIVRGTNKATAAQSRLNRTIFSTIRRFLNLRAIIGLAAGTGIFGAAIKNTTQFSATLIETAEGIGITASELDIFRRTTQSFGLEALQADRALTNVAKAAIDARNGLIEAGIAFQALGIPKELTNALDIVRYLSDNIGHLDPSVVLRSFGQLFGERSRTVLSGLLSTPGAFGAAEEAQRELGELVDAELARNKDLDQSFVDLQNTIRRALITSIAQSADALEDFSNFMARQIPRIAAVISALGKVAISPTGVGAGVGLAAAGIASSVSVLRRRFVAAGDATRAFTTKMILTNVAFFALFLSIGIIITIINKIRQSAKDFDNALISAQETNERIAKLREQKEESGDPFGAIQTQINVALAGVSQREFDDLEKARSLAIERGENLDKQLETFGKVTGVSFDRFDDLIQVTRVSDEFSEEQRRKIQTQIDENDAQLLQLDTLYTDVTKFQKTSRSDFNDVLLTRLGVERDNLAATAESWRKIGGDIQAVINTRNVYAALVQRSEARGDLQRNDQTRLNLLRIQEETAALQAEGTLRNAVVAISDTKIRKDRDSLQLSNLRLGILEQEVSTQQQYNILRDYEISRAFQGLVYQEENNQLAQQRVQNFRDLSKLTIIHISNIGLQFQREERIGEITKTKLEIQETLNELQDRGLRTLAKELNVQESILEIRKNTLRIQTIFSNLINRGFQAFRRIQTSQESTIDLGKALQQSRDLEAIERSLAIQRRANLKTLVESLTAGRRASLEFQSTFEKFNLSDVEFFSMADIREAGFNILSLIDQIVKQSAGEIPQEVLAQYAILRRKTAAELASGTVPEFDSQALQKSEMLLEGITSQRQEIQNVLTARGISLFDLANLSEYRIQANQLTSDLFAFFEDVPEGFSSEQLDDLMMVRDVLSEATGITEKITRASQLWQDVVKSIQNTLVNILVDLTRGVENFRQVISNLATEIFRLVLNQQLASAIPRLFESLDAGSAQTGGFAQGLTLVGEGGPEYVDFTRPGRVYSNATLKAIANSGSSGSGNTFSINTYGNNPQAVRAEIINLLPLIEEAAAGRVTRDIQKDSPIRRNLQGVINR